MYCEICERRQATSNHHLVFGRGLRDLADEDGLTIGICDHCHTIGSITDRIHDNTCAERLSKMLGQMMYERNKCAEGMSLEDARKSFRARYGRSYL